MSRGEKVALRIAVRVFAMMERNLKVAENDV
jgi:hypothetical protein